MASTAEILARIDESAPLRMNVEASVRDYCILALQFLKGQADFSLDGTHGACILINSDGPDDENRLFRLEDQLLRDAKA